MEVAEAIIKSLASILENRDASLVSCSDDSERETVRSNFIEKKLSITDNAKADAAVATVCEKMKGDRSKSRVTFYYLLIEELGAKSAYLG
jgi:hypothetical protein